MGFAILPGITLRLRNLTLGILTFELISAISQIVALFHADALVLPPEQVASLAHLGGALGGFLTSNCSPMALMPWCAKATGASGFGARNGFAGASRPVSRQGALRPRVNRARWRRVISWKTGSTRYSNTP